MSTQNSVTIPRASLAAALLCMLGALGADAQSVPEVEAGDRVRLTVDGVVSTGRLHSLSADSLSLEPDGGDAVLSYPLDAVERVQASRGQGALTLAKAGGAGLAAGMAAGQAVYFMTDQTVITLEGSSGHLAAGAFVGLATGLVVGIQRNDDWREVPLADVQPVAESSIPEGGSRLRLRTVEGTVYEGALRSRSAQDLELTTSDGEQVTVSIASIETLELHQGRRRRPLRHAAQGAVGGALVGALRSFAIHNFSSLGCTVGSCPESNFGSDVRKGAVWGLAAGVVMGLLLRTDHWEEVPVNGAASVTLAPHPGGGLSFGLTVPFSGWLPLTPARR